MGIKKNNIIVVFSSHLGQEKNEEFTKHIDRTIGTSHKVICYTNYNEFSLAELYNNSLNEDVKVNTIMVFCHPDIIIKTKNWGRSLLNTFNNTNYGIIGVAGTTFLAKSGMWWEDQKTMFGIVNHTDGIKEWESRYSPPIYGVQPVVTVDGVFFAVDPSRLEHKFNEKYGKFHFYDLSFCIPNYLDGVDIGVITSIRILHKSVGMTNEDWEDNRVKFSEEYVDELPIGLEPEHKEFDIELTDYPKVSVIIPTKNNYDVLLTNIFSWKEKVKYKNYEILIADTGSDSEVKEKYKNEPIFSPDVIGNNIKIIEYDFYNFGQINNDMVRNHTSDDTELILFCNDDIELLNDAISRCVQVYQLNKNVGTIGIRLHFGDSRVQHCGVVYFEDKEGNLHLSHKDMGKTSRYSTGVDLKSQGNTAAFMMINRKLFMDLGCFNETYVECFEDVELNFKCLLNGKKNITVCDAVAYHYESTSRNKDPRKLEKLQLDYFKRLHPFYKEHKEELKKYLKK